MLKNDVYDAVVKRACGYSAVETVEEYAAVDGNFELVKKRVTTKDVPILPPLKSSSTTAV